MSDRMRPLSSSSLSALAADRTLADGRRDVTRGDTYDKAGDKAGFVARVSVTGATSKGPTRLVPNPRVARAGD